MGRELVGVVRPNCVCGHSMSDHYTETVDDVFMGLWNPDLAGKTFSNTYVYCEVEGCDSTKHGWGFNE